MRAFRYKGTTGNIRKKWYFVFYLFVLILLFIDLCWISTYWHMDGEMSVRYSTGSYTTFTATYCNVDFRGMLPLCVPYLHSYDDVIKWKHFPRYWPFVWGIHRSRVNSPFKGKWRGALIFSLICAWINGWVNNLKTGDFRRHRAHCDVTVMVIHMHEMLCCAKTYTASSEIWYKQCSVFVSWHVLWVGRSYLYYRVLPPCWIKQTYGNTITPVPVKKPWNTSVNKMYQSIKTVNWNYSYVTYSHGNSLWHTAPYVAYEACVFLRWTTLKPKQNGRGFWQMKFSNDKCFVFWSIILIQTSLNLVIKCDRCFVFVWLFQRQPVTRKNYSV